MAEPIVESYTEAVLNVAKTEAIKVLHVDDDHAFLKVAKQCLDTQGEFEVDTASSVNEALEKLKKTQYDVVVSDYQMLGKDGLEFLKELREKGNTVPFIVFTGKGREEVAVRALNLGADGYFNKMGRAETVYGELAYGIRQTVGNRRAEQLFLKSEDKYRRLVETLREGIWAIDKESYTTFVNPRMADMLGYTADEMLGKPLFSFMDERGVEICKHLLERRKQGVEEQHDFEFLRKDGKRIYTTLETSPITDDNGNYIGALASVMDMTERKKMDEEIKSLARFPSENPNSVLRIGQDSSILFANDAGKALLKKLNCEVGGSVPTFLKNLTVETLKSKSRRSEESEIEGCIYRFHATPIIDRGYVNVYVIDITERRKAQDILKESEAKYRTLVEQSSQGIVIAQGVPPRLVFANPAMVRISGYTSEELASVPMERLIHPDDRAVFFSRLKERFEGKPTSSPNEYRAIRKDGKTAWIAISASRIEYGGQSAVQAVFVDITESKKTEQAIIENKQKFESLFKGNPEAAAYLGPDFCILDVNPRFEKLFGYSLAEVKGKNIDDVVVQGDKMEEAELLNERTKEGYVYHNTLRRRKDGSLVPVSVSAAPMAVEGGLAGIVAMYKDISESKDAEKKLEMMNEKLRVVGGFTRHDVRNKLATVTGNVFLTKKSLKGNPEALERLGKIDVACRQIVQIFDFATAYEKLGVEEPSYVDVTKTLEEALSLFQDLQNVEVTSNCHGLAVLADSLLRQLFYNLIDNSLKHGEKVGQIRIYYETTEDGLRLVYEDDGMGIATAEKPKLFKEGHGNGTGYGLYLIKKITEVYGWSIEETGEAGKGARFVIIMRRGTQDGRESYRIDPNQ